MKNSKKIHKIFLTLILVISIMLPSFALAETNAGIKPGSIFYFFDTTLEKVGMFFIFNSEKKAEKALEHAEERLAEAQEVADENKPDEVAKAMNGYEKQISFATEKSKDLDDNEKSEKLLNTISENTARHQEVLLEVLEKIPENARQAIENAIEVSKRGQEEALKQIFKLEEENLRLKEKVEELKEELKNKKDVNENVVDKNNDVEKLKKEVEALKKSQEDRKIAEDNAIRKQEAEAFLTEQRKIEEQTREIKKIKAEQSAEEKRLAELARQRLQDCLNNNYTKEQLRVATEGAISTLNNSAEESRQRTRNDYNSQIEGVELEGQRYLTSVRESQRGFATNSALLVQIQDDIDRSVEDLELRMSELLATIEINLSQQILDVRTRQIEMEKETVENVCY